MKTIAIKIGSSVILTGRNKLDEFRVAHIAGQVASLHKRNIRVVMIVSGAVACGAGYVDISSGDPKLKQVAAGIGQVHLISVIRRFFEAKNISVAQILLTKDRFHSENDKNSLKETLEYYLQAGIVPVINENDVADLNSFGGNDFLAAEIATMLRAEQMVMLSRMEASAHGTGGGKSKRHIAERLNQEGIRTSIVDGKERNIIINNII